MWSPLSILLKCLHPDLHPPKESTVVVSDLFHQKMLRICVPRTWGWTLGGRAWPLVLHIPWSLESGKVRWGPDQGPLECSAQDRYPPPLPILPWYTYSLLFEISSYATLLLQKTCIRCCFDQLTEPKGFLLLQKKKASGENSIQCLSCSKLRGGAHPKQQEWRHQTPFPGTALSIRPPELWTVSVSIWALSRFILCIC